MYKLFMAFRYLRAHKIIYFSIAGVAIGIMTMVLVTSIMSGFARDMRARIRGMQAHIAVASAEKNLWILDYEAILGEIRKVPHVAGAAPRLEYDAWLLSRGVPRDVHLVGVVPERERLVSDLERYFRKGGKERFDFKCEDGSEPRFPGLVLGFQLLRAGPVSLWTARHASPTPIPLNKEFEVVGFFKSGMSEYDATYAVMDLGSAQRFLEVHDPPRVNVLAVSVDDYERHGQAVRKAILDLLHARHPCAAPELHGPQEFGGGYRCGLYRTITWEQARAILLQAVKVEQGIQIILLFLIVLVAGFNIIAIYTLVVRAKTRDIGILRALGATEGGVTSVFLLSGGLCGLVGSIFGILLGLLLSQNVNAISDFIRVASQGMNVMGRGEQAGALGALLTAACLVVWNGLAFYKERPPRLWRGRVGALVALLTAAWFGTSWLEGYRPRHEYDPNLGPAGRVPFAMVVGGSWVFFCAAWRILDRWRRRPVWIFSGFAGTIYLIALFLAVLLPLGVISGVLIARPGLDWRGLELFPVDIYYLDRIPVYADAKTLTFIVAVTLLVSVIFSIYPARRAAASNPIEAIRDE